jgi:hypothetical protein
VGLAAELAREDRVVAELRVGVQGQVVGREVEVVLEQGPQALGEHRREARGQEVPEEPVVDEDELRVELHGPLEQPALRAHGAHHPAHLAPAGHLEPVRTEVAEALGLEELVEVGDQLVDARHGVWRTDRTGESAAYGAAAHVAAAPRGAAMSTRGGRRW